MMPDLMHSPRSGGSARPARGSLADDPGLGPIGEIADIAAVAEFGHENQDLTAREVDVQGLGRVAFGQGRRLESLLTIHEDAEDDAPERPGPLIDADQGLEAAIPRLDPIGEQGPALRPDPPV